MNLAGYSPWVAKSWTDWGDLAHMHTKLIKVKINQPKKENPGKISLVVIGEKIQNNNKTKKMFKKHLVLQTIF